MSVKVMSMIWEHYPAGGGELVLALALADWASHDGTGIWPSVQTMADKTRQSERAVQYQLAGMKESGWLEAVIHGGGRRKTTTYRLTIDRLPQGVEGKVQFLHPFQEPLKGCKTRQKRVQNATEKGAPVAPDPLLKATVKEPSGSGQGKPSPVAVLFKAYQQGIQTRYLADYPHSAQANGQLAGVVRKLSAERATASLAFYLASDKPFYLVRRHALDLFVKDCATLNIEAQQAASGISAGTMPCAYCRQPSIGRVNGREHCRAHGSAALDNVKPNHQAAA